MWNPFKKKKEKKQLQELNNLSVSFAIVGELNRRGLVHWQVRDKLLLIEESLALVEMVQGAEGFRRFLEHLVQWQNYQLLSEAYEQQRIEKEAKAVREANSGSGKVLTNSDIQRIRLNARNSMEMTDPADMKNLIREFDIMVIRANATSEREATQSNGQLLAVGHFDGEKLEMATYDEVKDVLTQKGEETE